MRVRAGALPLQTGRAPRAGTHSTSAPLSPARQCASARTRDVAFPVGRAARDVPRHLQRVWGENFVEGGAHADLVVGVAQSGAWAGVGTRGGASKRDAQLVRRARAAALPGARARRGRPRSLPALPPCYCPAARARAWQAARQKVAACGDHEVGVKARRDVAHRLRHVQLQRRRVRSRGLAAPVGGGEEGQRLTSLARRCLRLRAQPWLSNQRARGQRCRRPTRADHDRLTRDEAPLGRDQGGALRGQRRRWRRRRC